MRKRFTKFAVTILIAALCGFSTACRRGEGETDKPIDDTKSQLNVLCWDGGFRANWLTAWADRFEEFYKDHSFEEGKLGVQVHVGVSKKLAYDSFATEIAGMTEDIFFSEQCGYHGFVSQKTALDITDAVTTPLTEYGENESIIEKMSADDRSFFGITEGQDTKYYGLPWYESFFGIQYDVDLFEENHFYLAAAGHGRNGFVTEADKTRSNGPDGEPNTDDDGLPATYDGFFKVCDKIVAAGMVPILWTGATKSYMNSFLQNMVADFEGAEQMSLNYSLNGTATHLVESIAPDGAVTFASPKTIRAADGYALQKQAGRYYALQFLEKLITTRNPDGTTKYINEADCFSNSNTHTAAQAKFLQSRFNSSSAIAMLAEGSWWYNEASAVFSSMSSIPGAGATERKIGTMPFPKPTADYIGEATFANTWITSVVVRSDIEKSKIDLAKQFIRFIHTDKSLSEFTREANGVRPFSYDLTAADAQKTSYFGKQLLKLHNNVRVVNPWSSVPLVANNLSQFNANFNTIVGDDGYNLPADALRRGISAKDYFNGLSAYWTESRWRNTFSKWL